MYFYVCMSNPDRFHFVFKSVALTREKKATGRSAFYYLKGAYRKDRKRLFISECSDRTRGKLKDAIFRLDIRKKLLL